MSEESVDTGSSNTDTSSVSEGVDTGAAPEGAVASGQGENVNPESTGEGSNVSDGGEGQPEGSETKEGGETEEVDPNSVPKGDYLFKVPEGFELDESLAKAISPILKENKVTQGEAQKLIDAYSSSIAEKEQASQKQYQENFEKRLKTWETELRNDSDFGGDKFDENSGMVREFLNATLPEEHKQELVSLFNDTGLGNHPSLVKYFHHLAKSFPVGEDQPTGGKPRKKESTILERMYPNG